MKTRGVLARQQGEFVPVVYNDRQKRKKVSHAEYTSNSNRTGINRRQLPLRGQTKITGKEERFTDDRERLYVKADTEIWRQRYQWVDSLLTGPNGIQIQINCSG